MAEVKRYDPQVLRPGMIERQYGVYVSHADFQKRDELVRELLEALTDYVRRCRCAGSGLYSYDPNVFPEEDCCECSDARAVLAKAKAIDAGEEKRS